MSGIAVALANFNANVPHVVHPATPLPKVQEEQEPIPSPASSQSTLPSLTSSATSSSTSSLCPSPVAVQPQLPTITCATYTRPNEHLAVLLPKQLWKPDGLAPVCDSFYCSIRFGMFERRHHCRKCGGVFCRQCTSRSTPLLDASNLDFLNPPRNVPLSTYESPESPVLLSKVCDDCFDQIHGCPSTPRTPDLVRSGSASPISLKEELSICSPSASPSVILAPMRRLRPRTSCSSLTASVHSNSSSHIANNPTTSKRISIRSTSIPLPDQAIIEAKANGPERSYGELDSYPLKRHSAICKVTGGGRWTPKEAPVNPGYRIPGCIKAQFEIEMEQEEAEARRRRENPVVRDGDFQYRFPPSEVDMMVSRTPFGLSTF
ncbi:hypothetical protein HGRIS_007372 [Hohenbuehelia grisea]|uniref:FYVE-type domain-containing protein n=1 Tax=Hohenbuehelia grisea TaxID=104357 RepID=A0ABR3J4K2_9AGAR